MPVEWGLHIVVPIFKGNICYIRNCSCYAAVMLLEHLLKVVEMVLGKRLHRMVTVNEMQYGFMPEGGTIDAVFVLRRMQE